MKYKVFSKIAISPDSQYVCVLIPVMARRLSKHGGLFSDIYGNYQGAHYYKDGRTDDAVLLKKGEEIGEETIFFALWRQNATTKSDDGLYGGEIDPSTCTGIRLPGFYNGMINPSLCTSDRGGSINTCT